MALATALPISTKGRRAISGLFSCPQSGEADAGRRLQTCGMIAQTLRAAGLAALVMSTCAVPAQAQTAEQYNRAAQAIRICSSAQGAFIPECAKLRGQYGASSAVAAPGLGGLGGLGGSKAGAAAGILGAVMGAANRAPPQAATTYAPPAVSPQALQEAIATCVRTAAGNPAVIQGCLAIANRGAAAPQALAYAPPMAPPTANGQAAGMAIYAAGQDYRSCVAANPNNWQACVQSSGLTGQPPR